MGFNASNWSWGVDLKKRFEDYGLEPSLATGVTRNIFSFLAHVHNDIKGGASFYSYKQIADKCLVARKTVIQHCCYLEQVKLLTIVRKKSDDGKINERNHFYLNFKVVMESEGDRVETDYSEGGVVTSGNQGGNVRLLGVVTSGDPKQEVKKEVNNSPIVPKGNNMEFFETVKKIYNEELGDIQSIQVLNNTRIRRLKAITKAFPNYKNEEKWRKFFKYVKTSSLMKFNGTDGGWKVNFDWLVADKNFVRIVEGQYHSK